MFGRRWRLFRLCDIPVALDASWLIVLALLTFRIASLFPALLPEQPDRRAVSEQYLHHAGIGRGHA